jgi:hypothetical protein
MNVDVINHESDLRLDSKRLMRKMLSSSRTTDRKMCFHWCVSIAVNRLGTQWLACCQYRTEQDARYLNGLYCSSLMI